MPTFKKEISLSGMELEDAYKALTEELQKEVYQGSTPGIKYLRDELQISTGALKLEQMEKAIAVFKKHEMTFIIGTGGETHYPVFRITCTKKVMGDISYR